MKSASAATIAILSAGQYLKLEFYKFVLPLVGTFYFTNADVALAVGGITYLTGLTIVRSAFTQATGLAVQSVDLTIQPQPDNPAGPVTIGGAGFLAACANGSFDGGVVTISKGFFAAPAAGAQVDTSPGIVPWFSGLVDQVQAGRFSADITLNDVIQVLNVQMPRNILQAGCVHALYDAGCGLNKAQNSISGTVTSVVSAIAINSAALLATATNKYALGILTFTSGALAGSSYTVSQQTLAGTVTAIRPWASLPAVGDTFSIAQGCDKLQATCSSGKFILPGGSAGSNLIHYRGYPYVPQPETLYDGGTPNGPAPTVGTQGGQGAGSSFSGGLGKGTYKP